MPQLQLPIFPSGYSSMTGKTSEAFGCSPVNSSTWDRGVRQGADARNPKAPNYANFDESTVKPYPALPDPLKLKNGKRATTAKMWWDQRRPEIVEDFDREIYGRMPKVTPRVTWEVVSTKNETNAGVAVVTKQLRGHHSGG